MEPVNLAEYEEVARGKLAREAYDYYAGGANDEVTLQNSLIFHLIKILP